MAMWVRVRNINPIGAVLTFVDGERREVAAGEVIEVSPEQAGSGPRWRRVPDSEVVESHQETREHAGYLEVRDLGSGLLAQESNWEVVADEKPAETAKESA